MPTGNSKSDRDTTGKQGNKHRDKTICASQHSREARQGNPKD